MGNDKRFSGVVGDARNGKPFQRFAARGTETVETVSRHTARSNTPLKRGVNAICPSKPVVTRYG
jgi:hypothetical protein